MMLIVTGNNEHGSTCTWLSQVVEKELQELKAALRAEQRQQECSEQQEIELREAQVGASREGLHAAALVYLLLHLPC
jgi:hypothetical protein